MRLDVGGPHETGVEPLNRHVERFNENGGIQSRSIAIAHIATNKTKS